MAYDDGSSTESEYYEELDEPELHSSAPEPVVIARDELTELPPPSAKHSGVDEDPKNADTALVQPVIPEPSTTGTSTEASEDAANSISKAADKAPASVAEVQPAALSADGKCGSCTATLPAPTPDMPVYHRCKCCKLLYPPNMFLKGHCNGCLVFASWKCSVCGREGLSSQDFTRTQRKQEVRTCKQCVQNGAKPVQSVKGAKPKTRDESEMKKLKREIVELKVAYRALKKRKFMQKKDPSAFTPEDAEQYDAMEKELGAKTSQVAQHKRKCAEITLKSIKKVKKT